MPTPKHWLALNLVLAKAESGDTSVAQIATAIRNGAPVVDITAFKLPLNDLDAFQAAVASGCYSEISKVEEMFIRSWDLARMGLVRAPWPLAIFTMAVSPTAMLVGLAREAPELPFEQLPYAVVQSCAVFGSTRVHTRRHDEAMLSLHLRLACSLARSPGTSWVESEPPSRPTRRRAPLAAGIRFRHVVVVTEEVSAARQSPFANEAADLCPFHHRRGHWAWYGPEAPMFGKYIGFVWKSHCTVGNRKNGEIHQSYSMAPAAGVG